MNTREFLRLLLCGALFASAFPLIRFAAPVFGPIALMDVRVFLAAGVLALWAWLSRQPLNLKRPTTDWLLLGGLNAAIPAGLLAFSVLHIPSSVAAIFVATVPLFTALIQAIWFRRPLSLGKGLGLGAGTLGVVVLSGAGLMEFTPATILALLASLLASLSYALGAIVIEQRFKHVAALSMTTGNFLAAGLMLLPLAVVMPPRSMPGPEPFLALGILVLFSTAIAWALFFDLIGKLGPGPTSSVSYLVPMFGVIFGALFMSEPVGLRTLLGFVLVLGGVALVGEVRLSWGLHKRTKAMPITPGGQA
jgi:drug/metabolite transporter (DMT)-like permease